MAGGLFFEAFVALRAEGEFWSGQDAKIGWSLGRRPTGRPEPKEEPSSPGHWNTIGVAEWTVSYVHLGIFGKSPLHMKSRGEF